MRFASNLGTAPRIAASRSCGEASARDPYRAQVEKRPPSWRQEACSHNSNNNPPAGRVRFEPAAASERCVCQGAIPKSPR